MAGDRKTESIGDGENKQILCMGIDRGCCVQRRKRERREGKRERKIDR